MIFSNGKKQWQKMLRNGECLRNFLDESKYEGKWFRGLYTRPASYTCSLKSCGAFWSVFEMHF